MLDNIEHHCWKQGPDSGELSPKIYFVQLISFRRLSLFDGNFVCLCSVMQAVCEAGLIFPLVNLLQNAEFDIKKEAAWAVSNATSGGSPDQIK